MFKVNTFLAGITFGAVICVLLTIYKSEVTIEHPIVLGSIIAFALVSVIINLWLDRK